ncbi:hypothetical protein OFY73_005020, partial [Salmonella enterica]|nr:hypothetical protein [Salmonella enterica]EKP2124480.1 hypothetical protein [Salmonella enterica]EKP2134111.1 hypothetical protein [Salmonella enterica]EKP2157307.1 hypothetical protein [Salmonella enterica]
ATSVTCHTCKGSGRITRTQTTRKVSYPWGKAPYWASKSRAVRPSDWEQWTEVTEILPAVCDACEGKGIISARCRCGGKGEVLDRIATKERGAPVFKTCERCSGNGFSAVPSTAAYKVILKRVPDLHVRTWTRNWKPFLEVLVSICQQEEGKAANEFQRATSTTEENSKVWVFSNTKLDFVRSCPVCSNHGYVHPNETDYEPCHLAGFLSGAP